MAEENKTQNPAADADKIEKLELDIKTAFKDGDFEKVKTLANEIKKIDLENHVAQRLLEKLGKAEADKLKEAHADQIKILEVQIKQVFNAGNLPEIEKLSGEIKKLDPTNKVVSKIEAEIEKARNILDKQEKKEKVTALTAEIKVLMKIEKWDEVETKANELLKVEEKNGFALKALKKVDKIKPKSAKDTTVETQHAVSMEKEIKNQKPGFLARLFGKKKAPEKKEEVKKEDKPVLEVKPKEPTSAPVVKAPEVKLAPMPAKPPMSIAEAPKPAPVAPVESVAPVQEVKPVVKKEEVKPAPMPAKPVEASKPAEPIPAGMHASAPAKGGEHGADSELVKSAEAEKPDTVEASYGVSEKKPGFFARLFKKKPSQSDIKPEGEIGQSRTVKVAEKKPDPEKIKQEKIKGLEDELKHALKDKHEPEVRRLMDEIRKLDSKNKAIKKAQMTLDKEKATLEAQVKKEKIKGLTGEVKEALKNEDWQKAEVKANELLKADEKNRFALKSLKKIAEAKKPKEIKKATPAKPKKPGFFTSLFKKKPKHDTALTQGNAVETIHESSPEKKKEIKPVLPKAEIPKPVATKAEPTKPAVQPIAFTPPPKPIVSVPVVLKTPTDDTAEPQGNAVETDRNPSPDEVDNKPTVEPIKSETKAPAPAVPLSVAAKPAVQTTPKSDEKAEVGKGNIFTKLFGKNETSEGKTAEKPSKSIIDTIVAKSEEGKKAEKKEKKEDAIGEGVLRFATVFLEFSVAFILISAGFFYVQNIDEENRVLSLLGIEENNAGQLYSAAQELEQRGEEENDLAKEIKKYEEEQEDENKESIQKIIDGRMDWPDLIKKLNEVTESIYEKNPLSQYVQYNNYSYDVEQGQLRVSATLSDPLGKNLTKLAEIEEAFRYYPKDKNDPTDEREPYFYGLQDFRSFSKSFDKSTGRYKSSFSLALFTKPPEGK